MTTTDLKFFFFFQAEDGIRDGHETGVQTCALPIWAVRRRVAGWLWGLRRHLTEYPLPLSGRGDPDRLGAERSRAIAIGRFENRGLSEWEGSVRAGKDPVDVGVRAGPDRGVATRRNTDEGWSRTLGTRCRSEHGRERAARVGEHASGRFAEPVEADEDGSTPGRLRRGGGCGEDEGE